MGPFGKRWANKANFLLFFLPNEEAQWHRIGFGEHQLHPQLCLDPWTMVLQENKVEYCSILTPRAYLSPTGLCMNADRCVLSIRITAEVGFSGPRQQGRSFTRADKHIGMCWLGSCVKRSLPGTKLPWTTSLYAHQLSSSLDVIGWAAEEKERKVQVLLS